MKINKTTLSKYEKLIQEAGYVIRYERGTFQSGYCILEHKKVIVLNKFLDIEGRLNTILEMLPQLEVNIDKLTLEQQKMYENVLSVAEIAKEETA